MKRSVAAMNTVVLAATIVVMTGVSALASIVQTLPDLSGDGWYELGSMERTYDSLPYRESVFNQLGYIAWDKLRDAGLPADAKIRFVGGVLLDELPEGYTYDFSRLKYLGYIKADVFPAGCTLTIPEGCWFRFRGANIALNYSTGTFTLSDNAAEQARGYLCNIVMNGKMEARDDGGAPTVCGSLTGTGTFSVQNFWHTQVFAGDFNFNGELVGSTGQGGNVFRIESSLENSYLRKWTGDAAANGQYIVFSPNSPTPCLLAINSANTGWGSASATPESSCVTAGAGILVHSGNAVNINKFWNGDLVLVADETVTNPHFSSGIGNVVITNFGESASGTIYVSPNINLDVGFHNDSSRNFAVDYRVWTNVNNVCTLNMSSHSGWGSVNIKGLDVFNLPRRIVAPAAKSGSTTISVSRSAWVIPFDFGAENSSEICPVRCESNGTLSIPAGGTVEVVDETQSKSPAYPEMWTEYPILTCASGGETAFAGWTIRFSGKWSGCQKEAVVRSTGLYVKVRRTRGFALVFR